MKFLENAALSLGFVLLVALAVTAIDALHTLAQEPQFEQKQVTAFDGNVTCEVMTYGDNMQAICAPTGRAAPRKPSNEAIYYQERF